MLKVIVRAYRTQLVETIVDCIDYEDAFDEALLNVDKHDWDVKETYDIENLVDIIEIDPNPEDDLNWRCEND